MPVVKGGVWSNIEDEILKSAVSKYGLNQWARVSSLLARKSPKQCKARWNEWLDPSIRKTEWSKDEDEILLHLAKVLPTQWRNIAPIVKRTATQCVERYQKLLDEQEQRENDDLGLSGPGAEAAAPTADDVRRLRPGELDPDPESKPARPDTIDMDEDEKEMLSEARARLANTQGKKAKRKARERQLEESRRLAVLQKRRELKNAGINIKVTTRKPGQMDYNADIPFEKAPAPGFHDTAEEEVRNEKQRAAFDPRKQQLANKRKGDQDDDGEERKRRKAEVKGDGQTLSAAATQAAKMQKIREAERSSKRKAMNLPAPQLGEGEMEEIIKTGKREDANLRVMDGSRGLVGNYSNFLGNTPLRTPQAPKGEDRVANETRNARARTETQSALFGGDNPDLREDDGTTGFNGVTPTKQNLATPNPMATPFRGVNGAAQTPRGAGATPMRTPRDHLRLNDQTPGSGIGQTPRELKLAESDLKNKLRSRFAALPQPKALDFEFDTPDDEEEAVHSATARVEDSAVRDAREAKARELAERDDFAHRTQTVQRFLPRPSRFNLDSMLSSASTISDPAEREIAREVALLIEQDTKRESSLKGSKISPSATFSDEEINRAHMEIALEASSMQKLTDVEVEEVFQHLDAQPVATRLLPHEADEQDDERSLTESFQDVMSRITDIAEESSIKEKRLGITLGGYQSRAKSLRDRVWKQWAEVNEVEREIETKRNVEVNEQANLAARLERLRAEVETLYRREREAQTVYRERKEELESLG